MARKVTIFTGQWADLPLETMCEKAADMGYDGLELCCWGDHFDVDKAARSKKYCDDKENCWRNTASAVGRFRITWRGS